MTQLGEVQRSATVQARALQVVVNALAALGNKLPQQAAEAWLGYAAATRSDDVSAPMRAAQDNNAGVACCLMSNTRDAATHFARAQEEWRHVRAHVEAMDVPVTGRSSVFHLRLAIEHHDAFATLKRERLLALIAAAQAITAYNAQCARETAHKIHGEHAGEQDMIHALSTAFGPECAEVRLLREAESADAIRACYRGKAEALARRAEALHVSGTGYPADVERAALITTLLHPSLLHGGQETD
jgi:hypothetical protein